MSTEALLGFVALPAMTMALAYQPILERLSVALVAPYAKAYMTKRVSAAIIDGLLIATLILQCRGWWWLDFIGISMARREGTDVSRSNPVIDS